MNNNAFKSLTIEEKREFDSIMNNLRDEMRIVKMESDRMAHEAEWAAANAFLNC